MSRSCLKDRFLLYEKEGVDWVINLLKAILQLLRTILPFIETLFLSFAIGRAFQSLSLTIIIFIVLIVTMFFWHTFTKTLAWGFYGFLLIFLNNGDFTFALIMGLGLAGIRLGVAQATKFF